MPFRAHYDADTGRVRGFYDLADFALEAIPAPSIAIDDVQHRAMLANGSMQVDLATLQPVLDLPPAVRLARAKEARKDDVDAKLAEVLARGWAVDDWWIQCRPGDLTSICGAVNMADYVLAGNANWPANFAWRARNDAMMPVPTPMDMKALGANVFTFVSSRRMTAWAKKAAIDALPSLEAVAAFDIDNGW